MKNIEKPKKTEEGETKEKEQKIQVERFYNTEHDFSISWYKDIPSLYNETIEK